ncbi:hypothetical protein [Flavobacterium sp.]|jgi:hypothetical protein|uniref:hypothetical protein n=1 Tax=Flavobacterium sp. TaxID=239 RepID=UPI0037C147C3
MKNLRYILLFVATSLFVACSNDDEAARFANDSQSGWVQFKQPSSTAVQTAPIAPLELVIGSSTQLILPVVLRAPENTDGLEVTYTITDVVGSSAGVIATGTVVEFPEAVAGGQNQLNQLTQNIVIDIVATSLTSNVEFDVTLTATSRSNVKVGLDDYPIKRRVKICSKSVSTNLTGVSIASLAGATPAPSFVPVVTPVVGVANSFNFNTCWGVDFIVHMTGNPATSGIRNYPGIVTINPNFSVTVVGINTPAAPNRYPGGTGTFNPCTKQISYVLNQGVFTNPFTVSVVLTPN